MTFGLIIIGDEILSGRRVDKHMSRVIDLLGERGHALDWVQFVGDDRDRITAVLALAFSSGDIVFCCGGIGATPDDHTRQCAAAASGRPLALHPEARALIEERMREMAAEKGTVWEPDRPDNVHRLNMGVFPQGVTIIPNPYNKIPGFSLGDVHFVPGFPVMAHPMIEWVLQTRYAGLVAPAHEERSLFVHGGQEATLTPLMETIESAHPGVRIFSLPSVDHPMRGRHIELGVKGDPARVGAAWDDLLGGLRAMPDIVFSTT